MWGVLRFRRRKTAVLSSFGGVRDGATGEHSRSPASASPRDKDIQAREPNPLPGGEGGEPERGLMPKHLVVITGAERFQTLYPAAACTRRVDKMRYAARASGLQKSWPSRLMLCRNKTHAKKT